MKRQNVDLKAGEVIHFSSGEYSDYHILDSYVAVYNVSQEEMMALEREVHEDTTVDRWDKQDVFMNRLVAKGWVVGTRSREIHIGSYCELNLT